MMLFEIIVQFSSNFQNNGITNSSVENDTDARRGDGQSEWQSDMDGQRKKANRQTIADGQREHASRYLDSSVHGRNGQDPESTDKNNRP